MDIIMRLSISNIAWLKDEDSEVYKMMQQNGFTGLDIAPARIFDSPFDITVEEGNEFKAFIKDMNLEMAGMQALLFGSKGLTLFQEQSSREAMLDYLKRMIDYAEKLGIKVLVFGSPKNRIIGELSYSEAEQIAIRFFDEIGTYAKRRGIYFCVEANPTEYGADFLTNTTDAAEFVRKVNNEGFKLHVDLGTIIMNDENIESTLNDVIDVTKHVHISVPFLELITEYKEKHIEFARVLNSLCYDGYIAIEMKNSLKSPNTEAVKEALEFVSKIYGGN